MSANFTPDQKDYKDYKSFGTFRLFVLENFPFIAEDFDALTYYQMLCKVVGYLKDVIANNEAIQYNQTQLLDAFNELQNYVNTYFNSLDIQTEINNKLDQMAQSGALAELVSQYLQAQAIIGFNNVNDLSNAINLANGSFAKTYGKISYNDGLGAFYKIRERTNQDVVDEDKIVVLSNTQNLIAEKIYSQEIINLENEIKEITNQTTIMIGDSFIQMFPNDNWALKLKEKLNLSDSETYIFGEGGAGMYQAGNAGHNFKQLLESKASQITNPNEIKRIICCGGTNDVNASSKTQIKNEIENFVNYCKLTYPNANIYIGMIGYFKELNAVTSRSNILNRVLPAYQECRDFGALYLNDVEYVMHDYSYYTDTVHPTSEGTKALASAIYQALKTGHVEYNKEQALNFDISNSDVTTANISWYDKIVNKMHTITLNGNFAITPATLPANSAKTFDLGNPNSTFLRLSNTNIIFKRYSNLRIVTVSDSSIYRPANLSIDSTTGHLKLQIENYGETNFDISSIIIQEPIIVPWLLW